jgi:hypothetical protein
MFIKFNNKKHMKGNKQMKNKLLATTAIVGLGLSGSAFAEVKLGGNIEYTGNYVTGKTAADSTSKDGIEDNIQFTGSKDTDFGSVSYGFKLENGSTEGANITFNAGSAMFQLGADAFQSISGTTVPNTGEAFSTVTSVLSTAYNTNFAADGTNKNAFGYALGFKGDAGTASIRVTPDSSAGNNQNALGGGTGTPTMTVMFSGNLGVDGLNVLAGAFKQDAGDGNTEEGKSNVATASYNFGGLTAGVGYKTHENQATTAAQDEYKSIELGLGYAVSDQLSLALQYITTDGDTNGIDYTSKEKITGLGIGYNLGGVALEVSYADVENIGGTNGSDGEVLQIRTVQKF